MSDYASDIPNLSVIGYSAFEHSLIVTKIDNNAFSLYKLLEDVTLENDRELTYFIKSEFYR